MHIERLTILIPEIVPPLLNQVIESDIKHSKMGFSQGVCKVKCTLNKDTVYPRDCVTINCTVDNSACKKPVEKYITKLVRRFEIINLAKKGKPIYMYDQTIQENSVVAKCDKNSQETTELFLSMNEDFFLSDEEKNKMPKLPLELKHMQTALSSSISGQLFKVMYVL
jgi:hypothetical protein